MRRRQFLFNSLKAALLLSPVIAGRSAVAQTSAVKRVLFWVNSSGYPDTDAFFPTGTETDFTLAPIMDALEHLKDDMVIVDGVDLRDSGPNPKGNNHIRTVGKVLTAKDVLTVADPLDGDAGGISVDQLIAEDLGLSTIEQLVHTGAVNHMRGRPFATGPRAFKTPIVQTELVWDKMFNNFEPDADPAAEEARLARLRARKSVLDDLSAEMREFRKELTGIERVKLDIHEDAIRRAELSVLADLDAPAPATSCTVPTRNETDSFVPTRSEAHFDLLFAIFACDRAQVAGMKFGYSGYHWRYEWVPNLNTDDIHDNVHHKASTERQTYIDSARWDWEELAKFVQRLKDTPEGDGTMLDNTLVFATSHFGKHHQLERIPVVFFGNANGQLQTGRYIQLSETTHNDKVLTSIAHLMGDPISGIGDDPNCGPLAELHS